MPSCRWAASTCRVTVPASSLAAASTCVRSRPAMSRTAGSGIAVLDDGTKVAAPRFLRRAEKKLKRAQRDLARKHKGSANREKARVKVARAHAHVADARRDFHHKLSTAIIRDNQAVYVEDPAVKGLARTKLAKSVHDAGWSAFARHAGVQGDAVRPGVPADRPVRADQPGLLGLRGEGRPQAAARPRMGMQGVRH